MQHSLFDMFLFIIYNETNCVNYKITQIVIKNFLLRYNDTCQSVCPHKHCRVKCTHSVCPRKHYRVKCTHVHFCNPCILIRLKRETLAIVFLVSSSFLTIKLPILTYFLIAFINKRARYMLELTILMLKM